MAGRPPKDRIDYAWWDVDILDNDPKIDKLIDAQGCVGFTIYFYLCQKAYGSNGYFYSWCFDDSSTTARKIGGGAGANSVEETVKLCFHIGLFDGELYDRWQILTSRGIQKRYVRAAANRDSKSVIKEYWLLKDEESRGFIKVALKQVESPISTPDNSIKTGGNRHFSDSRVEESRVEESIVNIVVVDARAKLEENNDFGRVIDYYENISASMPSPLIVDGLRDFSSSMSADVIIHAIDISIAENKRSWSYLKGILKRYRDNGVHNMADVATGESEYESRKEAQRGKSTNCNSNIGTNTKKNSGGERLGVWLDTSK